MIKWLDKLLPRYAYFPFITALLFNNITYFLSRPLTSGLYHHNIGCPLDELIPVVPFFIVFYWLAYIQWVVGFIAVARESREMCYRYLSAEIIAKAICLIVFFVFPTTLTRPEIAGSDVFSKMLRFLYNIDSSSNGIPDNLFPSIHVLESWFCLRVSVSSKKNGKAFAVANIIFTALVFASVVLLKQHVIVDIAAGIAVFEIGMLISKCTHADRLFFRFDSMMLEKYNTDLTKPTVSERILFFGKKAE